MDNSYISYKPFAYSVMMEKDDYTGKGVLFMKSPASPLVVAIAAVSGGGKTTVVEQLAAHLPHAKALYFDHYQFEGPEDIIAWLNAGADYNEWGLKPLLDELGLLLTQPIDYILLDFPFAKQQTQSSKYIDATIFIDTPLDVALARRLMRDFSDAETADILENVQYYADYGRAAYLHMLSDIKPNSDKVIDGTKSVSEIVDAIAEYLEHT